MYTSTFHVISRKFGLFFGQCGRQMIYFLSLGNGSKGDLSNEACMGKEKLGPLKLIKIN